MMLERAIYGNEELKEIPLVYQDMWEYMEDLTAKEVQDKHRRDEGGSSHGGDGWPSIAARSL